MKIAALVCTFNEEAHIATRVENLAAQVVPHGVEFSIHVLDNGSTDATRTRAEALAQGGMCPVQVHALDPIGKCGALFWGFRNVDADWFVLTDANTVFGHDVVASLWEVISSDPGAAVLAGNLRSLRTELDGERFLREPGRMPGRFRLERLLGVFTGANGGCYCVRRSAVEGVWLTSPVRNDDFVISVFAAARGRVHAVPQAKAYEVEDLTMRQSLRQKFRDALGHHQALWWVAKNVPRRRTGLSAAAFRIAYWFLPLTVGGVAFLLDWRLAVAAGCLAMCVAPLRRTGVRLLALYAGFLGGMFRPPAPRWTPER